MIAASELYEVLSHIDYAVRCWPAQQEGPFNPRIFEDAFRRVMRDLAGSGKALELNVGGPLRPWIPQWWSEEGGRAITFASDAHTTDALAGNFYEATAMAEHFGFRQGLLDPLTVPDGRWSSDFARACTVERYRGDGPSGSLRGRPDTSITETSRACAS
jgi:hypothetical protein